MFSIAKLFADIAKALNAPVWVVSHGLLVIFSVGLTWGAVKVFSGKNEKIESVPGINAKLDKVIVIVSGLDTRIDNIENTNKKGHDSILSVVGKGFGNVQEAFAKTQELNNQKFQFLNRNIDEKFALPDKWIDDLINRISSAEKKNESPYRLTAIP